ncbi:MAG: SDR family oxidoreductase [Chitinophagales bacterium]|nr:SDR family oxidoreductase [Chitinophagales bacterium]
MRVLITGGAGYLGTELVKKLVQMKSVDEIIVYDNLSKGAYNFFLCTCIGGDNIKFIEGDILDTRKLKKSLDGIDVLIHAAAKISTPYAEQDPHMYEQVNHWGSAELSYAIEESNIKKFIHISSVSVYGSSPKNKLLDEQSKLNPRTNYGISKMRGESFSERLLDKLPTYILRLGNLYGFNQTMRFDAVINKFAFDANFLNKISIHGDGRQERSFIHVDKAAKVITGIVDTELTPGIYNLVDSNRSVMDIALTFKEIFPQLEMQFINQHLQLRNLTINPNCKIFNSLPIASTNFKLEMEHMLAQFAFQSC